MIDTELRGLLIDGASEIPTFVSDLCNTWPLRLKSRRQSLGCREAIALNRPDNRARPVHARITDKWRKLNGSESGEWLRDGLTVGIAAVGIIGSAVAVGALVCGAEVSRGVKFRSDGSRLLEGLDLRRE
jgi:hypothetical protein